MWLGATRREACFAKLARTWRQIHQVQRNLVFVSPASTELGVFFAKFAEVERPEMFIAAPREAARRLDLRRS
jgi:hypothetical protein